MSVSLVFVPIRRSPSVHENSRAPRRSHASSDQLGLFAPQTLDDPRTLVVAPQTLAPRTLIAPRPMPQARPFTFYLGTHRHYWLQWPQFENVPLFISYRQMRKSENAKVLRPSLTRWCMDSGGFIELSKNGRWTFLAKKYAASVRRFYHEVGQLDWAACMDWMTEECVLEKTGGSVEEHQRRTIDSLLELRDLAPDVPWAPVLQGWARGDHLRHVEDYARRGIDLWREKVVCVGSVCRRSDTMRGGILMADLASTGLPLHALGFKTDGLAGPAMRGLTGRWDPRADAVRFTMNEASRASVPLWMVLRSADSTAWSIDAMYADPMPEHTHKHCNNCEDYALRWRAHLLHALLNAANTFCGPGHAVLRPNGDLDGT